MNLGSQSEPIVMPKKATTTAQRRRRSAPATGRVRLREQFRSYARSVILEAGEDVLASQGVFAARMEEVAQKARVAVGTIYNLIGDREALVAEILRIRNEQVVALLDTTREQVRDRPFREQAQACMTELLSYCREHRRFLRVVLESERGPACAHKRLSQEMIAKIRELYRDVVALGIAEGVLRPNVHELGPAMLMGMMREVILMDVESEPTTPASERVSELLSMFVEGAGVR
jgi:TetR/AcrR family transcriptional regulator